MLFFLWAWLFVCLGLAIAVLGPAIPALRADFSVSLGGAGVLFTIHSLGYFGGVLYAGPLSDRYGRRIVSALGAAGLAAGMALAAFASSWPWFLGAMIPCGLGFAFIDVGLNAAIGDAVTDARRRAAAMNLLHGAFPLGTLVAPAALAIVWQSGADWRMTFIGISAFTALAGLPLITRAAKWPTQQGQRQTAKPSAIFALLREPRLAQLAALQGLYVGVELGIAGWIATYLMDEFRVTAAAGAASTSLYWAGFLAGRPLLAWLTYRFDPAVVLVRVIMVAVVCGVIGVMAPTAVVATAAYVAAGVAICGVFPTVMALALHDRKRDAGAVTALIAAAASVGGLIWPWLAGAVADTIGLRPAMAVTAAPLLPMIYIARRLHSDR